MENNEMITAEAVVKNNDILISGQIDTSDIPFIDTEEFQESSLEIDMLNNSEDIVNEPVDLKMTKGATESETNGELENVNNNNCDTVVNNEDSKDFINVEENVAPCPDMVDNNVYDTVKDIESSTEIDVSEELGAALDEALNRIDTGNCFLDTYSIAFDNISHENNPDFLCNIPDDNVYNYTYDHTVPFSQRLINLGNFCSHHIYEEIGLSNYDGESRINRSFNVENSYDEVELGIKKHITAEVMKENILYEEIEKRKKCFNEPGSPLIETIKEYDFYDHLTCDDNQTNENIYEKLQPKEDEQNQDEIEASDQPVTDVSKDKTVNGTSSSRHSTSDIDSQSTNFEIATNTGHIYELYDASHKLNEKEDVTDKQNKAKDFRNTSFQTEESTKQPDDDIYEEIKCPLGQPTNESNGNSSDFEFIANDDEEEGDVFSPILPDRNSKFISSPSDFLRERDTEVGNTLARGSFRSSLLKRLHVSSRKKEYDITGKEKDNMERDSEFFSTNLHGIPGLLYIKDSELYSTNPHGIPWLSYIKEDDGYMDVKLTASKHPIPILPSLPEDLSNEQMMRRLIVASIVDSENSYVSSLYRLVQEYEKPLMDSNPPILSNSKIKTIFYKVSHILQCHTMFQIALSSCISEWDREEKIGDVFVASFSKSMVLDIYSDFVNNFSLAMETAKNASRDKPAFVNFLKTKQIVSPDRLSLFGLMVKPVQRFPQFILLLQDLLKHTPKDHHDRMSLQLALTQLEHLADQLNERKRESEQCRSVKQILSQTIAGKLSMKSEVSRYLLRQDDMIQADFNNQGIMTKTKKRRLFLMNDLLVCATVTYRSPESQDACNPERFNIKWSVPLQDVEVMDGVFSSAINIKRLSSSGSTKKPENVLYETLTESYQQMSELMHDFEVISRIDALVNSLKGTYHGLNTQITHNISQRIQKSIQAKDEEIAELDSCSLQLSIATKSKTGHVHYTFQAANSSMKRDWIMDLHMAKLALDPNNNPGWDIPELEGRILRGMPLFFESRPIHFSKQPTEVKCGCHYVPPTNKFKPSLGTHGYLWVCSSDGDNSHISIISYHHFCSRVIDSFDMADINITSMESVPGCIGAAGYGGFQEDTIWMGTDNKKILVFAAAENVKRVEMTSIDLLASIIQIKYYRNKVFVALANGCVASIWRARDGCWKLKAINMIEIGTDPVTCIMPLDDVIYCASGREIVIVDIHTEIKQKCYGIHREKNGMPILHMTKSGVGLWLSFQNSSTICLYHLETFKHLQDINVASNVNRILAERDLAKSPKHITITALVAARGVLWVGTNVGIILSLPLPRLEGVPIINGRASVSYHAHNGPTTLLIPLHPQINHPLYVQAQENTPQKIDKKLVKQRSDTACKIFEKENRETWPLMDRRASMDSRGSFKYNTLPANLRNSKTGLGLLGEDMRNAFSEMHLDVYGLYENLLRVPQEYEVLLNGAALYGTMRRSEPELPGSEEDKPPKTSVRPKSLDLSNMNLAGLSVLSNLEEEAEKKEEPVKKRTSNQHYHDFKPRTMLVVSGGGGYMNWRKINEKDTKMLDAYVIIWEMKL